jgi:hypothetical protein
MQSSGQRKMDKMPAKTIGKYELVAKIAQGGMGAVYKAKHPTLNRFVLLKKLTLRGGSQLVERFKREARIMMDIKHDHIVHVYDHFKEGTSYYIVEEFVDGISLESLLRRERYLSNEAAMLILYEVCKALQYAHEKGVIHRDIKPGNILLSNQGDVKLVDFGIATSREESEEGLTRDGMTLGTPSYIPPEQIENAKNVDKRADIYSLGVVLYEMMTGKTPYPGSFTAETIALIHKGRYTPPQRLNPKIAPILRAIIRKAMRPRPRRRYVDVKAIIRILERRIRRKDPASIRQAVRNLMQGKEVRDLYNKRRPWLTVLIAAVAAVLVLGAGAYYLYSRGLYYDLFRGRTYGALRISAVLPKGYKEAEQIFLAAVLYRETEGELVRLDEPPLVFQQRGTAPKEESLVLATPRLYLEAGRYRLKLSLEGELLWRSFYLHPRALQQRLFPAAGAQEIELVLDAGRRLPLSLAYTVRDYSSGQDLTDTTFVSVFLNGDWVPWNSWTAQALTSGGSYRFRFERFGYFSQAYSLLIEPYQSLLTLEVGLVPVPGTLQIVSNAEGLKLLLNGSELYLTAGEQAAAPERVYVPLPPLSPGEQELVLDPGEYLLTVKRDDSLSRSVTIDVRSGAVSWISVEYDRAKNRLELKTEQ